MRRKKIMIGAGVVVLVALGVGGTYLYKINEYQKMIADIKISDVDLNKVKNGTYQGDFDASVISVKVEVEVNDHKITKIDLIEHNNGRGEPAEVIVDEVVKKQTLKVDTVSGATNSSKVILKSIEKALESGVRK